MTTKNIEFKITGDTKDLESKLSALKQKFREMESKSTIGERAAEAFGEGTPMTERAQRMQESYKKSAMEFLEKEHNVRERYAKVYEDRLKRLNAEISQQNKGSAEQLELIKKRDEAQKALNQTMEEAILVGKQKQQLESQTGAGGGGGGGVGGGPSARGPSGMGDGGIGGGIGDFFRSGWGQMLKAFAVMRTIERATDFAGEVLKHGQEMTIREAATAQLKYDVSGRREELEGDYLRAKFFAPERAAGMGEAGTYGAGLGTRLKNLPGIVYHSFKDVLSGDIGFSGQQEYIKQKQLESERESIEANMRKSPEQRAAYEFFSPRRQSFLQAQQMSGMGDTDLMGFLGSAGGMFTEQQKLGAMGEVYGAGGSTAQGRRAFEALQLKRDFGIQSSAQVLGMLSGNIGGGATGAESVARKLLAEAFSAGLDSSKFSRETEKFLEYSAKFVAESGARTPEAMMRVAEGQARPLGTAMADVRAAAGAESSFQNIMGRGAGDYSLALQMSKLRGHGKLGGLSESQRMQLAKLSPAQIRAGGDYLEGLAKDAGYENYEDFVQEFLGPSGVKSFGATSSESSARKLSRLGQLQTEAGFDIFNKEIYQQRMKELAPEKQEELKQRYEEGQKLLRQLAPVLQQEGKIPEGLNPNDISAYVSSYIGLESQRDPLAGTFVGKKPQMPTREKTAFDFAEMTAAEGDQERLRNAMQYMDKYSETMKTAGTETENFAKAVGNATKQINQALTQQQTGFAQFPFLNDNSQSETSNQVQPPK